MTPTHKPEDGDRAPISNGGAELETVAWLCEPRPEGWNDHAPKWKMATTDKYVAEHPDNPYWKPTEELVRRIDATALLAEKAQRIERLEAALRDLLADDGPEFIRSRLWDAARSALSQPHPHGG